MLQLLPQLMRVLLQSCPDSVTHPVYLIQMSEYGSLLFMLPVLFSIGKFPVSSFGVFITLGFLVGVFLIWRLSRAWDLDEERILDLTLLTFLGGLVGARFYFVLEHLPIFAANFLRVILINKYPGFSFWGSFLGGWLSLFYISRAKKEDFWLLGDIAAIGLLGGLIFSDLGCFLGGCQIGIRNNSFLAVNMVGILGKRFPVQILEALLLSFAVLKLWSQAAHFHLRGKILSLSLIYIGIIKLLTNPLKQESDGGQFLSLITFLLGVVILYRITKRNILSDIKNLPKVILRFLSDPKAILVGLQKYWYNQKTSISWKFRSFKKSLRRLNVRFSQQNTGKY